jgi:hypothetical protein
MPSSASSTLLMELMASGENSQTWGTKTNTNLSMLDAAINGTHAVSTTGGNTTLTNVDYTNDEAKKSTLDVTGTLVSNATITIPNTSRSYRVFNRTSGAYTLGIKTSSGSAITIPTSTVATVYCDGSNVVRFVTPISDYSTGAPATSTGAAASSVSVTPTGNLSSTTAQAALAELQGDIDTLNTTLTSSYQPLDADLTAIAALATTKGNMIAATGSAWSALGVGTNGYTLIAKSGASTGMAWSALVPAGTRFLIHAASVDGWTIDTNYNNYAVRIVTSGAGDATAGTQTFTDAFVGKTILKVNLPNYTMTDSIVVAGHTHFAASSAGGTSALPNSSTQILREGRGNAGAGADYYYSLEGTNSTANVGATSSDGGHTVNVSVALGGSSTALLDVSYVDVGLFTKNAY